MHSRLEVGRHQTRCRDLAGHVPGYVTPRVTFRRVTPAPSHRGLPTTNKKAPSHFPS